MVQLLGLDHFDLAKELLRNRLKVVWVSKLRQAQDEAEVRRTGAKGGRGWGSKRGAVRPKPCRGPRV